MWNGTSGIGDFAGGGIENSTGNRKLGTIISNAYTLNDLISSFQFSQTQDSTFWELPAHAVLNLKLFPIAHMINNYYIF